MKPLQAASFRVAHSVPGRIKLKSRSLRSAPALADEVESNLSSIDFIDSAAVRRTTGSVIIAYDRRRFSPENIVDRLGKHLDIRPLPGRAPVSETDAEAMEWQTMFTGEVSTSRPVFVVHLVNLIALSGVLAFILVKRFLFRSSLSQKALSPLGGIAMIASLPLLLRALKDLRSTGRFGLFPFLVMGCFLAVFLGEAITAIEILWVLSLGLLQEEYATDRSRRAVRGLFRITDSNVVVLVDGAEVVLPVSGLKIDDEIVLRSGDRIPADGEVIRGEALVDEAHITGRSNPEYRSAGSRLYAGTTLWEGTLFLRAEKVGSETYLARMLRMVEESLARQTESEKKADELAHRMTATGLAATVGTLLLTGSLSRAFSVMLVMTCPCATVLSASTAVAAAIGNAARKNVLVKGGIHLEHMKYIDTYCFDKTGTVTEDVPSVIEVVPRAAWQDRDTILGLAAAAENGSNHPMARALDEETRNRSIDVPKVDKTEAVLGRGIRAEMGGEPILVGNGAFMEEEGVNVAYFKSKASSHQDAGETVLYVARKGKPQGMIVLSNQPRAEAGKALTWLKTHTGARICLLSGDTEPLVRSLSGRLGFDEFKAPMLGEEKALFIEKLESAGRRVAMIGDGINDALALSKATIGIGMGAGGSEVAIEASDVALVKDDLMGLVFLHRLSERMMKTIEQNFWIANATNIVGIVCGGLGWFPPVMAGVLHVSHTMAIMANSSRLLSWNPALPADEEIADAEAAD